jgi:hypothetical protein
MRYILGLLCVLFAALVFAAASQGLKWSAVTTYEDDTAIESTQKVVYLVFDTTGKQVGSTFTPTLAASALPSDGCYFVRAAFYAQDTNSIIPGSQSDASSTYCIKPPPKRPATPTGLSGR